MSLSRFLCAWVTSLATACDSSLRTDSSLMMANAWLMSMGRALNDGRDIFAALPAAQLEILRCAPITAVRSPFRADGTVTRCTSRIDRITRATHDTHGSSPADRSACPPGLGCGGARFPLWAGNDDYAFALSLQELVFDSLLKIGTKVFLNPRFSLAEITLLRKTGQSKASKVNHWLHVFERGKLATAAGNTLAATSVGTSSVRGNPREKGVTKNRRPRLPYVKNIFCSWRFSTGL